MNCCANSLLLRAKQAIVNTSIPFSLQPIPIFQITNFNSHFSVLMHHHFSRLVDYSFFKIYKPCTPPISLLLVPTTSSSALRAKLPLVLKTAPQFKKLTLASGHTQVCQEPKLHLLNQLFQGVPTSLTCRFWYVTSIIMAYKQNQLHIYLYEHWNTISRVRK